MLFTRLLNFTICFAAGTLLALSSALQAEDPSTMPVSKWVKSQLDDGRLKVEFYEPGKPRQFQGWTDFQYQFQFQYECQLSWPGKTPKRGTVVLMPTFSKISVPTNSRVELPKVLEGDRWYESVLARHELEHVRVGAHPRLAMLGRHLIKKVRRIERTVDDPADVTREWVRDQVHQELTPRKEALHALVMDINKHIDKVTNHGAKPLENREEFLANLYLKENLDEMKFAYLPEVLDLLATTDYQRARVQISEIDPPAAEK